MLLSTYSHADAAYAYVRAQTLSDARGLPEDAQDTVPFLVEHAGEDVVHVGARADQEEDDEEEGLEVEEGRLQMWPARGAILSARAFRSDGASSGCWR